MKAPFSRVRWPAALAGAGACMVAAALLYRGWLGEPVHYNRDVRPIINEKCIACHGGVKQSGELSFLFREEALAPAKSGLPAVVPGSSRRSGLMARVLHHDPEERMPQEAPPLTAREIDVLRRWIRQGAQWETHWAYVPPDRTLEPPQVADSAWSRSGIDRFLYARLDAEGLEPAPEAAPQVLLRRVSLDLVGLPPPPALAGAFLKDPSPVAYERLVDSLLASPAFGERWAALWLDLARYADSKGYEKDLPRTVWKYRDWVIDAFNADMPFDRFTVEQLAGDLLPGATPDQLVATAFHRNTMANDEGGTDNEEFRTAAVIDRVNTTFEVWQGTTMACVQCHSHPYDPIRHEEYYRAMAFFNNTEDRDLYNERPKLYSYPDEDARRIEETIAWARERAGLPPDRPEGRLLHDRKQRLLYDLDYRLVEAEDFDQSHSFIELLPPDQDAAWQIQDSAWIMFEDVDLDGVRAISFRAASAIAGGFIDIRLDSVRGPSIGRAEVKKTGEWENWVWTRPPPRLWRVFSTPVRETAGRHDVYFNFSRSRDPATNLFHLDWIYYHEREPLKDRFGPEMNRKLEELASMRAVMTPILRELPPDRRRPTRVFERGSWLTPGDTVTAGVPAAFGRLPDTAPADRLAFARWLASPENPLTARVIVNRFWEQLFGYGIVETVEDFGTQGDPPSHPGLLDWLAVRFMDEHGWSVKRLLREMVTSAAYRQASAGTPEKLARDPQNRLLSRGPRRRLSAEQVRDQVLAVSGLLDPALGGPSVHPPRPDEPDRPAGPADAYRRALYTSTRRTNPHPLLTTFDGSGRQICLSRRVRTNTPLQALALMNDRVYVEAARALAGEMDRAGEDVRRGLEAGYRRAMLRPPAPEKLALMADAYGRAYRHYAEHPDDAARLAPGEHRDPARAAALTLVANALLNLDEFVTTN